MAIITAVLVLTLTSFQWRKICKTFWFFTGASLDEPNGGKQVLAELEVVNRWKTRKGKVREAAIGTCDTRSIRPRNVNFTDEQSMSPALTSRPNVALAHTSPTLDVRPKIIPSTQFPLESRGNLDLAAERSASEKYSEMVLMNYNESFLDRRMVAFGRFSPDRFENVSAVLGCFAPSCHCTRMLHASDL